jgi:transposase
MNYNQNTKIAQITPQTLIIGVDIAKLKHVARAQDYRGLDFGKPLYFEKTNTGFDGFLEWINQLIIQHDMEKVINLCNSYFDMFSDTDLFFI